MKQDVNPEPLYENKYSEGEEVSTLPANDKQDYVFIVTKQGKSRQLLPQLASMTTKPTVWDGLIPRTSKMIFQSCYKVRLVGPQGTHELLKPEIVPINDETSTVENRVRVQCTS